jgi:hypothetical protein
MTPATQRPVWARGRWDRPRNPSPTADGSAVGWTESWAVDEHPAFDLDPLLDDYSALSQAEPEEIAAFIARYGVPELASLETTDGSESNPLRAPVQTKRAGSILVGDVRRHARGIAATRRLAASLVTRHTGDPADWADAWKWLVPSGGIRVMDREDLDDYKLCREHFADLLSDFLAEGDVLTRAEWPGGGRRLALGPEAGTFIGALGILLAREVGAEGQYICTSCGARVTRNRPPRKGEKVYCDRVECKREQQRRNQARWRAKKRAEGGD